MSGEDRRLRLSTPRPRSRGPWISILLLVLLPLVFYQAMVFQGMEPNAADTQAVKPIGSWARTAEGELGETPRWIPGLFGGMPSYGSFTYIPRPKLNLLGQAVASFPNNRGLRYVILLSVAGIFGFLFFRRQGFSDVAATSAALLYSLTPYFAGSVAAGHSTKLEALCLVPALFWALDRLWARPGLLSAALLAAVTATLAWANHPQIVYYAAIVALVWLLFRVVSSARMGGAVPWSRLALFAVLGGILALGALAKPYLEIREYTPHSVRGAKSALEVASASRTDAWDYATAWSFHPGEAISFVFPSWFGLANEMYWGKMPFTHSTHYFGIVALALALLGLWRMRRRDKWIWLGISLFVLFVGFGRHLPVLYRPMFEWLPLFDKFRVPSMIYAILPLCVGMLLAGGIDELRRWVGDPGMVGRGDAQAKAQKPAARKRTRATPPSSARPLLFSTAGVVLVWLLCLAVAVSLSGGTEGLLRPGEAGRYPAEILARLQEERASLLQNSIHLGCVLLLLSVGWVAVARARLIKSVSPGLIAAVGIGALAVADVWIVGQRIYHPAPTQPAEAALPLPGAARFLSEQAGPFRIFPAQSLFSSNAFVLEGLESLGGYQPAKLRIYQDLLDSGVVASPGVLRMLNTRYVLATEPMNVGTAPVFEGDGYVYELPQPAGVAWAVGNVETVRDAPAMFESLGKTSFAPESVAFVYPENDSLAKAYARAEVVVKERALDRIRFSVSGSGEAFVVLSEVFFGPGWRATLDGEETPIFQVNHVLRGMTIPGGTHEIDMVYQSQARNVAGAFHVGAGVLILLCAVIGVVQERRRSS